jgi:hypothetical protein
VCWRPRIRRVPLGSCVRVMLIYHCVNAQGVDELSELIKRADKYYKEAETNRPPPERLNYVHVPKTKEEAAQARKIARAVGDAQVCPVLWHNTSEAPFLQRPQYGFVVGYLQARRRVHGSAAKEETPSDL